MKQKTIYLDNAATTALDPEVLGVMMPFLNTHFGNPSSIHSYGRLTRSAIERSRKTLAQLWNTSPAQIFFTSGATESNNMALHGLCESTQAKHIITSPIEHHAVLHTILHIAKIKNIQIHWVKLNNIGHVDLDHLAYLLKKHQPAIVSLMHGNNEIGNLLPLDTVTNMCLEANTPFHSDTVQTIGHYPFDLQKNAPSCIVGSAHKFHGPKGVGFIHLNHDVQIPAYIHGGSQERNMRGGTENIAAIVGMAKAMEKTYASLLQNRKHIEHLKTYFIQTLKNTLPSCTFNGSCMDLNTSLYHVVSVRFPKTEKAEMLLFNFDIAGIAVSGGSACTSGAIAGSHVLEALHGPEDEATTVRFSFSKYNTTEEIDFVMQQIKNWFVTS